MKKLITILFIINNCNQIFAFDSTIVFRHISYSQLFAVAQKEKKPIMLFFHFDGCSACNNMEKNIFTHKNVYSFYNEKFICFSVNILVGEGVEIATKYKMQLCPAFIFLNSNGMELHKIVGFFDNSEFIKQGTLAFDTAGSLSTFHKRYEAGERTSDFLRSYCYLLRNANDLDSFLINQYISTLSIVDFKRPENVKFIYEFIYYNQQANLPYGSRAFKFMIKNKKLFNRYFDSTQVNARLVFVLQEALYNEIDNKNEKSFKEILETLKIFDGRIYLYKEMDGRLTATTGSNHIVLNDILAYYEKNGDSVNYENAHKLLIKTIWNESNELNSIAWNYYEKYNDSDHLSEAIKWIKRSVELKNTYANNDTWASILYKLGKSQEALTKARIAIDLAKKENVDYSTTTDLINKIEK